VSKAGAAQAAPAAGTGRPLVASGAAFLIRSFSLGAGFGGPESADSCSR
jgi:hypothetical protein